MSKWFEVNVQIWKRVLVEVEDNESAEDAVDVAAGEVLCGQDGQAEATDGAALEGADLARAKRHADEVISL